MVGLLRRLLVLVRFSTVDDGNHQAGLEALPS